MMYKRSLTQRIIKSIVIIAICTLSVSMLSGCFGNDINDVFADYQKRIQRLLDQPSSEPSLPLMPRQPGISEVRQEIPEGNISLFESMRLNHCRAGQLIAQRNSSLGKVQSVQARVLYEIEMIPALAECLQDKELADTALGEALATNLQEKIQNLPLWIDRFWTSEPAIRDTFRPGRGVRGIDADTNFADSLAALEYFATFFTRILENPEAIEVDLDSWQKHMEALGTSQNLPELLRTQQHVVGWLRVLNQELADAPNALACGTLSNRPAENRQAPQNAIYMQNVLNSVWIQQLQPALATFDNEHRLLSETMHTIQAQIRNPEWQSYLSELLGEDSLGIESRKLARTHAEQWQKLLAACQLTVR